MVIIACSFCSILILNYKYTKCRRDYQLFLNSSYPELAYYVPTVKVAMTKQANISIGKNVSDKSIINIMNSSWKKNHPEYWQEGHRAMSIFSLACQLCKWGVDGNLAMEYFVDGWGSESMTENEIIGHVRNAYKAEEKNFGKENFTYHSKKKKVAQCGMFSKPKALYK